MDETTYQAALLRIAALWNAGAGQESHADHTEFHALYEEITAYEIQASLAYAQPSFQIDTPERLEWYVSKKADLHSKMLRLEAQYKLMLRDLEREEERLDWRFAAQAEQVLRRELGEKKRSVRFLSGTVGLRKTAARVKVGDEAALIAALIEQGGPLQQAVVQKVDARVLNQVIKVDGEQAYLPDEGSLLELPGLIVKAASETFYVKAGNEE